MKIKEIRCSYLNSKKIKLFVADILGDFENKENYQYEKEKLKWWKKHKEDKIELSDNLLELLSKVNLEIKKENVETKYKNKFKKFKKKYLRHLLETGKIDEIVDSGNLWKFIIGDYSFHQPKEYYKKYNIIPQRSEDYIKPDIDSLPEFNIEEYKCCLLTIINNL